MASQANLKPISRKTPAKEIEFVNHPVNNAGLRCPDRPYTDISRFKFP